MPNWSRFTPSDFEYDFDSDKLSVHHVNLEETVEYFFSDFEIRRNKSHRDRYQLIGRTIGGRRLKIIFNSNPGTSFALLQDGLYDSQTKID
ncbi:MAG: hypothetical protein A3K45_02605 [Chloroflexi bacterium RIFOXYC12_FULL_59_14]|nr:MAG: hypothetical protein A3K45_02605 [Chloroflexi bacterium RIFOXYC12_FULL_59_14]